METLNIPISQCMNVLTIGFLKEIVVVLGLRNSLKNTTYNTR